MSTEPKVRVNEPKREGQTVTFVIAEDSLPPDHPARLLWTALGEFDLSGFLDGAKAVEGRAGRKVTSPRMLLTLWGYALLNGVIRSRKIVRLCESDMNYRWILGHLKVERSTLSVFLVSHRDAMFELFTDVIGSLMNEGLLFLPEHRLAQDGTRVRADASLRSFRTAEGLRDCREQAELHLKATLARMDEPEIGELQQLARERGAMDVLDRVKAATRAVQEVAERRARSENREQKETPARASTTDPDARLMKMSEGGRAPGYNLQFATVGDPAGGRVTIVGLRLLNEGNDKSSLMPMRRVVTTTTGLCPLDVLADSDHATLDELRQAAAQGYEVISTVPRHWRPNGRAQDDITKAWMTHMSDMEVKKAYRGRPALAERPNAVLKAKLCLTRMPVRGLERVECVALLAGIMINFYEHRHRWIN